MTYCIHCGAPLPLTPHWPHQCSVCRRFLYNSPTPVVALVLRSWGMTPSPHPGVLVIRRGIDPHKDTLAFPGGYLDYQETWQQAAIRECREEIGVALDPRYLTTLDVVTTPTNFLVIFVGYSGNVLTPQDWSDHDLTRCTNDQGEQEVLSIGVLHADDQPEISLGIPAHNHFWKQMILP